MRIAQVAPLFESVPPKAYGGTERVVAYLTDELVKLGHEVTLFASGDSVTCAQLRPGVAKALRLYGKGRDPVACHYQMLEQVYRAIDDFDIIHFHVDYLHFPGSRRYDVPHVTTLHGRLDVPDLDGLFREYREMPVVSISDSQRLPLPHANWQATVYHGIPREIIHFHPNPGNYLAFIGRISPEKRPDLAIEIARRTGMEIKMAAKVDRVDQEYFEQEIVPLLERPGVEYVGEIGDAEKNDFLGNAYALVFPIDWPEPFGLAMVESFAAGTPVVAMRRGSVPEIMHEGLTGFIVDNLDEAVRAVECIGEIDRAGCRQIFEQRFSATRMAEAYLDVYRKLAGTAYHSRAYLTNARVEQQGLWKT